MFSFQNREKESLWDPQDVFYFPSLYKYGTLNNRKKIGVLSFSCALLYMRNDIWIFILW